MLLQKNLFNKKNKLSEAIEKLKMFNPPEGGYYLAFSGGKDSCVVKALADMAGVKYVAHYSNTKIDPPELVKFIKEYHKDVIFDNPKVSMLQEIPTRGFPIRQGRWCCEVLKEQHGTGVVLTGIRWAESNRRATRRRQFESCYKDACKTYFNPIIEWSNNEVWEFIRKYNIPYCKLYDEGFTRLGCLFCPMSSTKKRIAETGRYPKFTKAFIHAFSKLYNNRIAQGNSSVLRWKNGEEMFWWWINDIPKKCEIEGQLHLFP